MFRFHVPSPIYEHLPKLYLMLAVFLSMVELSPIKWVTVMALVLAAWLTGHRRRAYRASQQREAIRRYVAERYGKTLADTRH